MSDNKQQNNFDIEINNETASGTYSNLALINHSNTEFVVDFIQMMPGMPKAQVKSSLKELFWSRNSSKCVVQIPDCKK